MGQVSRKLKKYILGIALGIALMCGKESYAQYNREYFFWVGRSCMMNNDYQEAIRTLNTLLRFDEDAFEGYFLRGIAKYNLDDLLGAEADFSTAIRLNPVYTQAYTYRAITRSRLGNYDDALQDFREAIDLRPDLPGPYYSRGVTRLLNQQFKEAIDDFDKVIQLDSTNSLTYFNRAMLRTQIGDYNRALDDYDKVALYSPNNVLVYYNRAGVYAQLGELEKAIDDYSSAIKLYPDFANAYIYRGRLRELLRDPQGAKKDRDTAQKKIAEYRSRLSDSTYSIYADTTQRFDRLLSFDSKFSGGSFDRITGHNGGHEEMRLLPLFKFTLMRPDTVPTVERYHVQRVEDFRKRVDNEYLTLSWRESNIPADTLVMLDKQYVEELKSDRASWTVLFERGVTQSLIKQYTNAVNTFSAAIEQNPSNPFLYLNRSTTRAEMIDFISSIDNSYQRITIDSDPANRLNNNSKRTYSYDEAVADLNKAIKLFPDLAYSYYNRANLKALSGSLPEAFEDYSKAIEQNPNFAEAYYNRGIIQIFMKDTRKGCLDISKAGELGIVEAYEVLKRYAPLEK